MGRIQRYTKDTKITDLDKFLGSDGNNYNKTVNYSARDVAEYIVPFVLNSTGEKFTNLEKPTISIGGFSKYEPATTEEGLSFSEFANKLLHSTPFVIEPKYVDVPSYSSSKGTKGERAYDRNFLYECVEDNKWIRTVRDSSFYISEINILLSQELYNPENVVFLKGYNLQVEYDPANTIGSYYLLKKNSSDSLENFVSGTREGGVEFVIRDSKSLLKLDGIDSRFVTNTFTARGLLGAQGTGDYTMGLWLYFDTLPTTTSWVWSAYNTTGTVGTGLKIRPDGILEFHRGSDVLLSTKPVTVNELTTVYTRYDGYLGKTEILINGIKDSEGTSTSTQSILVEEDHPAYIGYHLPTNEYTEVVVGRLRMISGLLSYNEIKELGNIITYKINLESKANPSVVEVIDPAWILETSNEEIVFTVPPNFNYGEYYLYLTNNKTQQSNKFDFMCEPIKMEDSFVEDFRDREVFQNRWEALDRAWGGENGGVVNENVYLDTHEGERVLVCEAHGDLYEGDIQGVGRFGEPKYNPDGTPWIKRVGGVAVSRNYVGYGSYEFETKVIPVLGVCSAFWNFHYQEIYPNDPRWDKMTQDYVRGDENQTGLLFQFNNLQHQNPNTAGTDTATSFITDGANTTYGLGIKGEPDTIGETLRYQGSTGYLIDFLNTSTITDPLNTNWMVMFWVKVDTEAKNNARHAIISQGNGVSSLGAQVYYQTNYYEIQTGIRGDTDSLILFGDELQVDYGKWYHVGMGVKDGKYIQYINGDEKMSAPVPTGTFTAQNWWRAIQNLAFAGGSAGTSPKDMSLSDVRVIKGYHPTLKEIRVHYGRPYFVGRLDFNYKNLNIAGSEEEGFYVVRNNEIDIEVPSHLKPDGDIELPSLLNAKFNSWKGEWQNWSGVAVDNYQYWEEYRDNYRPMGIDVTDGLYHRYRYDWYPDRVEFYVDDVHIITNTNYMYGIDSLNIPETAGKLTIGAWFPSGRLKWAGKNADFEVEKMYTRKITYTAYDQDNQDTLMKVGETYPKASTDKIGTKYDENI